MSSTNTAPEVGPAVEGEIRLTPAGTRMKEARTVLDRALVVDLLTQMIAAQRERAIHGLRLLANEAESMSHKAMSDSVESQLNRS